MGDTRSLRALLAEWPKRLPQAHKYHYGHVFVLGGSPGMYGAAIHAGLAALRVGAGLVTLGVESAAADAISIAWPDLMTWPMPLRSQGWNLNHILEFLDQRHIHTVLLGPGLGRHAQTQNLLRPLLAELAGRETSVLLDADALDALKDWKRHVAGRWVITPHAGELKRVFAFDAEAIPAWVKATGMVCLYKSPAVAVYTKDKPLWRNPSGHPALAKAGSGDVLAGLVAGLLAQGLSAHAAAVLGAYVHGRAARRWVSPTRAAESLLAGDLLLELPGVIKELRKDA